MPQPSGWGAVPPYRSRLVEGEVWPVSAGIHSRPCAADELGVEDPEGELRRWQEEQEAVDVPFRL